MSSTERIAIITGAARGIGAAVSLSLARAGVRPVLVDLAAAETVEPLLARIREVGPEPAYDTVDVTDVAAVEAFVDATADRYGSVDILVNNAGVLSTTGVDSLTESEWQRVMDVNLKAGFFFAQKAIRHMRRAGWGRVINISSMAGRMGGISVGCAYATSKAAIIGMTRNLARALARSGITVNAIAPGPVEGAMYDEFTDEQRATLEQSIPVGRLGRPEEIGDLAAYLASDSAGYVTGAVIDANGGAFTG